MDDDEEEKGLKKQRRMEGEAKKDDLGKLRLDLVEPCFLKGLATILGFGARKYGDNNWKTGKGLDSMRLYAALQRHLVAWREGENLDNESQRPHLWHAACELMFLVYFQETNTGVDSRPLPLMEEEKYQVQERKETINQAHRITKFWIEIFTPWLWADSHGYVVTGKRFYNYGLRMEARKIAFLPWGKVVTFTKDSQMQAIEFKGGYLPRDTEMKCLSFWDEMMGEGANGVICMEDSISWRREGEKGLALDFTPAPHYFSNYVRVSLVREGDDTIDDETGLLLKEDNSLLNVLMHIAREFWNPALIQNLHITVGKLPEPIID